MGKPLVHRCHCFLKGYPMAPPEFWPQPADLNLRGLVLADVAWPAAVVGVMALLYVVALVSGLIILLPTLVKDFFALRIRKNIKRLWMDVHNALGIVSLPFHLVMALTCVVFAFHDEFYQAQGAVVYPSGLQWEKHAETPPLSRALPLPTSELLRKVNAQLPDFLEGTVTGLDVRYGTRARTFASTHLAPYIGEVDTHDLPGQLTRWCPGTVRSTRSSCCISAVTAATPCAGCIC
jgi:uncharacterized iron-regulated membrane protein